MENKKYRVAIEAYFSAISLAKELLKSNIIDENDFKKIERKLRRKYGLKENSIFREK